MKKFLGLMLVFFIYSCHPSTSVAQNTTLTATVVDSDGTTWANGSYSISFVPNAANQNVSQYNINGTPLSTAVLYQNGSLNGSGQFSITIYNSSLISPALSSWSLNICPNSSAPCGTYLFATSSSSQDISAALTATIPAPRFKPVSGTYGYIDSEASINLINGSTYWNVTLGQQRYYNKQTTAWVTGAGTAGGTVSSFIASPGNWPSWLAPSVTNATSNPSLSVTASAIPNSALANPTITLGTTTLTLGAATTSVSGLTVDGASPANLATVDTTSSINTQLSQRIQTNITSLQSMIGPLQATVFYAPLFEATSGNPVIVQPGTGAASAFNVFDPTGSMNLFQIGTNGNILNLSGQEIIPGTTVQFYGVSTGGLLLVNAAPSGTGAPCLVIGCTLINATGTTQATTDNSTYLATTAYVHAYISSISSAVTSINTLVGTFSFPAFTCVTGSPNVCSFSGTAIANQTISVPALTSIPANTCWGPSSTTSFGTQSMPGLATSGNNVWPAWKSDPSSQIGWGGTGGAQFAVWPDAITSGQADWKVCNQTTASLSTNAVMIGISAQ